MMTNLATEFEKLADRFDNAESFAGVQSAQAWGGKLLSRIDGAWPNGYPCPPQESDAERDEIFWAGVWIAAAAAIADQHAADLPANFNALRIDHRGNGVTIGAITKADWRTHAGNGAIVCRWLAEQVRPVEWSRPYSMLELRKLLTSSGPVISDDTVRRMFRDGRLRKHPESRRGAYRIDLRDIPPGSD